MPTCPRASPFTPQVLAVARPSPLDAATATAAAPEEGAGAGAEPQGGGGGGGAAGAAPTTAAAASVAAAAVAGCLEVEACGDPVLLAGCQDGVRAFQVGAQAGHGLRSGLAEEEEAEVGSPVQRPGEQRNGVSSYRSGGLLVNAACVPAACLFNAFPSGFSAARPAPSLGSSELHLTNLQPSPCPPRRHAPHLLPLRCILTTPRATAAAPCAAPCGWWVA